MTCQLFLVGWLGIEAALQLEGGWMVVGGLEGGWKVVGGLEGGWKVVGGA